MPDKIVNHFVLADGTTAKYNAEQLAGSVPEVVNIRNSLSTQKSEVLQYEIVKDKFLHYLSGGVGNANGSCYCKVAVTVGDTYYITTSLAGNRGVCLYNGDTFVSGFNSVDGSGRLDDYPLTIPAGVDTLGVSTYDWVLAPIKIVHAYKQLVTIDDITEEIPTSNIFDGFVVKGRYINKSGITGVDSNMCFMPEYIPVSEGDDIVAGTGENTKSVLRFVTAYDSNKTPIASKGLEGAYGYVVPDGVSYIRLTLYIADVENSTFRINRNKYLQPYEPNGTITEPNGYKQVTDILGAPLSTLPSYIKNTLSYVPLGQLSKPYFCLVSDDGDEDMISYSIPMVESKNIPCTWAVMSTSEIFRSASVNDNVAEILDSINNHGCAIAQHGGINWTEYNESELNKFFDDETAFLSSYGLVAKSAVVPSHYMSELICAIAGGRYGVCRSGLNGDDGHGGARTELVKPYPNYTCGARTNLYGLTSANLSNLSTSQYQETLDYAFDNNLLFIGYFHENSITDNQKQQLEGAIDYAINKGFEFITLDEVKTII